MEDSHLATVWSPLFSFLKKRCCMYCVYCMYCRYIVRTYCTCTLLYVNVSVLYVVSFMYLSIGEGGSGVINMEMFKYRNKSIQI